MMGRRAAARIARVLRLAALGVSALCGGCGTTDVTQAERSVPEEVPQAIVKPRACPQFGWWMALPKSLAVGETTEIMVAVDDADTPAEKLAFAWSAESGWFSTPHGADTSYTCERSGRQRLALIARDDTDCLRTFGVEIECLQP
jgi:hypothetical protein